MFCIKITVPESLEHSGIETSPVQAACLCGLSICTAGMEDGGRRCSVWYVVGSECRTMISIARFEA